MSQQRGSGDIRSASLHSFCVQRFPKLILLQLKSSGFPPHCCFWLGLSDGSATGQHTSPARLRRRAPVGPRRAPAGGGNVAHNQIPLLRSYSVSSADAPRAVSTFPQTASLMEKRTAFLCHDGVAYNWPRSILFNCFLERGESLQQHVLASRVCTFSILSFYFAYYILILEESVLGI